MSITDTAPARASQSFARRAFRDLIEGLARHQLWLTLGWQDVRQRYKRSILGPFWITATLGVSIGALGTIYSNLFHMDITTYLPYVATGFLVWNLILLLLNEGCLVFIMADNTIKQLPFPLSTYVYREVWRNLIVFAHNFIIYVLVAVIFHIHPGWQGLYAIPGLVLLLVTGIGWGIILGIFSARFRDIPQLVTNFVQVMFFVTPVLWTPETLGSKAWLAGYNPMTYLVDIVRLPLLGTAPSAFAWEVVGGVTILSLALAVYLYARFRWRIPYWI